MPIFRRVFPAPVEAEGSLAAEAEEDAPAGMEDKQTVAEGDAVVAGRAQRLVLCVEFRGLVLVLRQALVHHATMTG